MKIQDNSFPFLFSGKFGDYVGRVVNGKQQIYKQTEPQKHKLSIRELNARRKMAITSQFLKHMVPVLQRYDEPDGKSGFHKAISHIMRHAIQGGFPDQRIDFSQVILGKGSLSNPKTFYVESPAHGLLEFSWSLEIMKRKISRSDRIFAIAYCRKLNESRYEPCGAERRERKFLMDVSCFSGEEIEVWFGFESFDASLISTSIYAGSINVL